MTTITKAAQDVLAERARQVNAEGWTPEHDDEHDDGSLAMAAACYAAPMAKKGKTEQVDVSGGRGECPVWRSKWFSVPFLWPDSWHAEWWKPGREADLSVDGLGPVSRVPDRRRDLVRAAALLLAEIERLDRASGVGVSVIDTADHVLHGPTGETWVVARVNGKHLHPCGWPPTRADLSDCTLVKKATLAEREQLLRDLSQGQTEHAGWAAGALGVGGRDA